MYGQQQGSGNAFYCQILKSTRVSEMTLARKCNILFLLTEPRERPELRKPKEDSQYV